MKLFSSRAHGAARRKIGAKMAKRRRWRRDKAVRLITSDEKWIIYCKEVRKRSWSKGKQAPQTIAKPGLTRKELMPCIWWDWNESIPPQRPHSPFREMSYSYPRGRRRTGTTKWRLHEAYSPNENEMEAAAGRRAPKLRLMGLAIRPLWRPGNVVLMSFHLYRRKGALVTLGGRDANTDAAEANGIRGGEVYVHAYAGVERGGGGKICACTGVLSVTMISHLGDKREDEGLVRLSPLVVFVSMV
ncbi:hypothetical protein EVAR_100615_1 [Eumeta japonica]|uniref:Uncharacterized protein n=1 Tax=Eumeta variegata TaxID=151549 RepID=A0A4C1Z8E4_EUMVA|nr:hypothetical protein EVAR_100615_1 [Eumeta japonica]